MHLGAFKHKRAIDSRLTTLKIQHADNAKLYLLTLLCLKTEIPISHHRNLRNVLLTYFIDFLSAIIIGQKTANFANFQIVQDLQ